MGRASVNKFSESAHPMDALIRHTRPSGTQQEMLHRLTAVTTLLVAMRHAASDAPPSGALQALQSAAAGAASEV